MAQSSYGRPAETASDFKEKAMDQVVQAADQAVLVPASSIVAFAGIEKVIGVEAGKAVEKRVKTGRRAGDRVEIVDGVAAGDSVVLEPGNIVSGESVRVVL